MIVLGINAYNGDASPALSTDGRPTAEEGRFERRGSRAGRPLVSIVTPSFNSEAFIEQTILSVAGQTYPHVEYIVIDGGSTDRTLEIIQRHQSSISYWVSEADVDRATPCAKGSRSRPAISWPGSTRTTSTVLTRSSAR